MGRPSLRGQGKGGQKNQCAYCKEIGYWKDKCPQLKKKQECLEQGASGKEEGAVFNLAEGLLD
ncbi:hypothetical protein AAY473_021163 [Plecturocebus cupreus]